MGYAVWLAFGLLAVLALSLVPAPRSRAAECPNEARRAEQGSSALPGCRAYELVTTAAKDSAEPVGALTANVEEREPSGVPGARAALAGGRFAWWSEYALPQSALASPYGQGVPGLSYLSTRTASGWSTENAIPPQSIEYGLGCQQAVGIVGWSDELDRGVLADGIAQESSLSPGGAFIGEGLECGHDEPRLDAGQTDGLEEREGFQNLFLRDRDGTHRLLNLTQAAAPHPRPTHNPQEYFPASFLAGSSDLSHVAFEEELPLTASAERISPAVEAACEEGKPACWEGHDNLYEWTEGPTGGAVRLVTVLPDGSPVEGSLAGATRNNGGGGIGEDRTPPQQLTPNVAAFRHAVSADGSRVFFEAEGGLFVREDGTTTVRIDAAQSGLPGASDGGGSFAGASADGSTVYFTASAANLLTDDTIPGSGRNLYRCVLPGGDGGDCALTNLTPAPEAGVLGVAGIGEEEGGAYVYLVATGVLTATVGPLPGQPNLYLRHGGTTTFIATLADAEEGESESGTPCTQATSQVTCHVSYGDSCDWTARGGCEFIYEKGEMVTAFGGLTSRVSANGRFVAFNSIRSLTGYDNEDVSSEAPGEKPDAQIFVYDAAADRLSCASCNPDPSKRPTAPATIRWPATPDGNSYQHAVYPQRNLSDDGELFFESYDALVPADQGGALSVYEYDAGSGQLSLISSGSSEAEAVFLDATPSGSDVFFMTANQLVPRDVDSAYDVYDARVGGGFPEAGNTIAPCESEAQCRPAATPPPEFPTPGTATFSGPGNVKQAPAAPRKKKRKHHKKHHKKRHRGHRHHKRHHRHGGAPARISTAGFGEAASGSPPRTAAAEEEPVEAGTAPIAVTDEATDVTDSSARAQGRMYHEVVFNSPECLLLGIVCHNSAGSKITGCAFEFATAAYYDSHGGAYDRQASCEPPPPYRETEQVVLVEAGLAALDASTTYHYRLVAQNEQGETGTGQDRTFTTLGSYGPPTIASQSYEVSREGSDSFRVELKAQINPHGHETSCGAQYVEEAQFEESGYEGVAEVPCDPATLPIGFGPAEATATVTGLKPGARYHFRFLAENSAGGVAGEDSTFLTFAIESFEVVPSDLGAGAAPEVLTERFRLSTAPENPWGTAFPSFALVNPKDIVTKLPPGLIGDPLATPRCTQQELVNARCSGAAQVGVLRIEGNRRQAPMSPPYHELPLYNLVPPRGVAAQLGAPLPSPVNADAHVDAGLDPRSGYGIEAAALDTTAVEGLISVEATIWGIPHDSSHDSQRFCPAPGGGEATAARGGECPGDAELEDERKAFLRNPTSCSSPPVAKLAIDAWQSPGDFAEASSELPLLEGCDEVPFQPTISVKPTATGADSPSGLHVDLSLPQPEAPGEARSADLRAATVILPEGLAVNTASADGLAACAPAQIGLESNAPGRCPDASKLGTVKIETPLLDHPVRGGVYLATPHENPFGSLLALYVDAEDPSAGLAIKLAGEVSADRATGRLTTTFDENPQLPFEHLEIDFFSGPRAPLKTPATCGTFTASATLTPWTAPVGKVVTQESSFQVDGGPQGAPCAGSAEEGPHHPGFTAGTLAPQAGAYSPFVLRLDRGDRSQELEGLSVELPAGLTGRLAGTPFCPQEAIARASTRSGRAEAADPSCPGASQVGTVAVGAGTGPTPLQVEGRAYLAGPYRGAPLSLAIVTPAVAGPFDLGTVVVRSALYVDPETARIHAVAGPLPTMLEGIPLDVRSIALRLDRPRFTLNPTSCEPMTVAATALSALGQTADVGSRFQVGSCEALPFAPKLALSLKGRTRRGGHPALKAVLTTAPGEANIAAATVTLPHSEFLEQSHLQNICTNVQFNAGGGNGQGCPAASVYGFARAETPLLDRPLEGPVFLRASTHELPDLVAVLSGQIDVVLDSRIDSANGRIRNSFEVVPDAPVETFTLEMPGGSQGLLVNSTDLCRRPGAHRALATFSGHNGKLSQSEPVIQATCRKAKKKGKR